MPRIGLKAVEIGCLGVSWRRNGRDLVGKGASDGGSVDVDFGDDALYASYTQNADVIWMSQFLDCFSQEQILSILLRAVSVMSDETCLYILDTYWDRQRFEAAAYSINAVSLYFRFPDLRDLGLTPFYRSSSILSQGKLSRSPSTPRIAAV